VANFAVQFHGLSRLVPNCLTVKDAVPSELHSDLTETHAVRTKPHAVRTKPHAVRTKPHAVRPTAIGRLPRAVHLVAVIEPELCLIRRVWFVYRVLGKYVIRDNCKFYVE
jgi:hypothetical protein